MGHVLTNLGMLHWQWSWALMEVHSNLWLDSRCGGGGVCCEDTQVDNTGCSSARSDWLGSLLNVMYPQVSLLHILRRKACQLSFISSVSGEMAGWWICSPIPCMISVLQNPPPGPWPWASSSQHRTHKGARPESGLVNSLNLSQLLLTTYTWADSFNCSLFFWLEK